MWMSPASVRISVDGCRIATRPRREWAGEPDKPFDTVTVCLDSQGAMLSTRPLFRLRQQAELIPHLEPSKRSWQPAAVRESGLACAWSDVTYAWPAPIPSPRLHHLAPSTAACGQARGGSSPGLHRVHVSLPRAVATAVAESPWSGWRADSRPKDPERAGPRCRKAARLVPNRV